MSRRKPVWTHITVFGVNSPEHKHPQRDVYIEAPADRALEVFAQRYTWPVGGWTSSYRSVDEASQFRRELKGMTLEEHLSSPYVIVHDAEEVGWYEA